MVILTVMQLQSLVHLTSDDFIGLEKISWLPIDI